jgi:hypothetical protein
MQETEARTRRFFTDLKPGDRVEVVHQVRVGQSKWQSMTVGTVVRTERRRHSLHYRRSGDDRVFSDVIVLSRDDGELTTVTVDEFTEIRGLAVQGRV